MHKLALMAAAALLAFAARAEAAPIGTIDQQDAVGTAESIGVSGVGQSFTPTLDSVDAFEFVLRSVGDSSTVRVDLFDGAGFGGALLGSSATVTIGSSFETAHFDLSAALTPGQIYTARVVLTAGDLYSILYDDTGSYTGGDGYATAGFIVSGPADLFFTEGLHATVSVPEPASLALVLAGLAGLGLVRRRRTN
jgi:hypothetical protein